MGKRFRHDENTAACPESNLGSKCGLWALGEEVVEAGKACDCSSAVAGCQSLERGVEVWI